MPFIAFDLKGTLYTFDKVIESIDHQLFHSNQLAKDFFDIWYTTALRDYIASSQAGKYLPLKKILELTLPRALHCFRKGMKIQDLQINSIMNAFNIMDLDSQAIQVLDLLISKNWDIWILSIDGLQDTKDILNRNELIKYVGDNILCCDELKLSKPHPKVYSELMRLAVHKTQRIETFYLISSYAFELTSAKNISLKTVFLNTTEEIYPTQMYHNEPDMTGTSLLDCVEKILDFEKNKVFY